MINLFLFSIFTPIWFFTVLLLYSMCFLSYSTCISVFSAFFYRFRHMVQASEEILSDGFCTAQGHTSAFKHTFTRMQSNFCVKCCLALFADAEFIPVHKSNEAKKAVQVCFVLLSCILQHHYPLTLCAPCSPSFLLFHPI